MFRITISFGNRLLITTALVLLLLTGCDPQINIYKQNDRYYSVFGFLNASADTQFIRIEFLRDSLLTSSPRNLNADVTVTDLTDNRSATLHDSIFTYLDGIAHNFYTTTPIKPTHTYRLDINGPHNGKTSGQVTIPDAFPKPTVILPYMLGSGSVTLSITGIKRLIAVNAIYYVRYDTATTNQSGRITFGHLADTTHGSGGIVYGNIPVRSDLLRIQAQYPTGSLIVAKIAVMVASGNPGWPDFLTLDQETAAIPDVASNIKGGTGLLGGVITDTTTVYEFHN